MKANPQWRIEDHGHGSPCWIWANFTYENGYGQCRIAGQKLAHRWSYITHVGPIPDGLEIDHLCGKKACVNPEHLEVVTPAENSRRSPRTKLTETDVLAIRDPANDSLTARELGTRYGVDGSTISSIRHGRTWRGVGTVPPHPQSRRCPWCGQAFPADDKRRRYCNQLCKGRASEARRSQRERQG